MAVLLVAMSVMAVMMTVAMPVWKQASQREKEEELVFRGKQYAHAIGLFQRKYANAYPPNFDVLINEKFLRKKYKDPITNDDFVPILAGQNTGATQPGGRGGQNAPPQNGPGAPGPSLQQAAGAAPQIAGGRGGGPVGGIMGVTSKSKAESIRLYNGRSHYNEWQFVQVAQVLAPGAGAAGTGAPGQRSGQQQPGGQFQPFGGAGGVGGRGRGPGGPGQGPGRSGGPFGPSGPNRGMPGTFNPFQPNNPQQPITAPGRGRG